VNDTISALCYRYFATGDDRYHKFFWRGVDILKPPEDAWALQQIIVETRPDVIIETGTANGGSALFMADVCELEQHGAVITCDVSHEWVFPKVREHPRITLVCADVLSDETAAKVTERCGHQRTMVVLDSDHAKGHVLRELELYAPLVSRGCYLIVEDTNLNGHPVFPDFGPGPAEALAEYLRSHETEWLVDRAREKFVTFNPGGYLLRR
jgi:cephalosporin hydroxylase